jgi:hypothetical protein
LKKDALGPRTPLAAMPTAEEIAQKQFDDADKRWTAQKFFGLGAVTLIIAISVIYLMSTTTGCSLEIVP